jgi:hypothetical protein
MERKIKHSAALAWSTVGDRNHYRLAVFDVVTRTFVPNGGLRWAAVDASRLKREPLGPIRSAENRQEALRANIGQPARKNLFLEIFQRDLAGPVPFVKIFGFPSAANQRHFRVVLLPHEGVSLSSRTLGTGCDGRGGARDERYPLRTTKSCGPDAPTLASSWR